MLIEVSASTFWKFEKVEIKWGNYKYSCLGICGLLQVKSALFSRIQLSQVKVSHFKERLAVNCAIHGRLARLH